MSNHRMNEGLRYDFVNYGDDGQLEILNQFLNNMCHGDSSSVLEIRPDPGREQRKGTPEVIFGETKETEQIIAMAQGLLAGSGRAVISRVLPPSFAPIKEAFREYTIRVFESARMIVIYKPDYVPKSTGGQIGV